MVAFVNQIVRLPLIITVIVKNASFIIKHAIYVSDLFKCIPKIKSVYYITTNRLRVLQR